MWYHPELPPEAVPDEIQELSLLEDKEGLGSASTTGP